MQPVHAGPIITAERFFGNKRKEDNKGFLDVSFSFRNPCLRESASAKAGKIRNFFTVE
jgi:hypothetical protein